MFDNWNVRSYLKMCLFLTMSLFQNTFMEDGERPKDTISRIGLYKLGVKLKPIRMLNEGYGERSDFRLFMHDYLVEIVSGKAQIASDDFVDLKWANTDEFLPTIKIKGDCTRLYGEYLARG